MLINLIFVVVRVLAEKLVVASQQKVEVSSIVNYSRFRNICYTPLDALAPFRKYTCRKSQPSNIQKLTVGHFEITQINQLPATLITVSVSYTHLTLPTTPYV